MGRPTLKDVERLAAGRLGADRAARVREGIRREPALARHYQRLVRVERLATLVPGGGPDLSVQHRPTRLQMERGWRRLEDSLPTSSPRSRTFGLTLVGVLAAAVAAWILIPKHSLDPQRAFPPHGESVAIKGSLPGAEPGVPEATQRRSAEVSFLCLTPDAKPPVVRLRLGGGCPIGSLVYPSVSSFSDKWRVVRGVAVDAEGQLHAITPADANSLLFGVAPGAVDEMLEPPLRLDTKLPAGALRLFFGFAVGAETLSSLSDAQLVERARRRARLAESPEDLSLYFEYRLNVLPEGEPARGGETQR